MGSAGQKELFVAGLTSALVCIGYLWVSWYGFDLLEEGYFATHSRRVQLGGLPYRDFSTPYTPGIFYLGALLMDWFGTDVVTLRLPQVISRVVLSLALYSAGRHLMPPFFAALPPGLILMLDPVPHRWSLHPGWITAAVATLGVLAMARYLQTGLGRWLLVSGLASGVGFAFKQNLAAYGLMSALWLVVVAERHMPLVPAPRSWRWLFPLRFILPAASNTLPSKQSEPGGRRLGRADASGELGGIASQGKARFRIGSVASRLRIGHPNGGARALAVDGSGAGALVFFDRSGRASGSAASGGFVGCRDRRGIPRPRCGWERMPRAASCSRARQASTPVLSS